MLQSLLNFSVWIKTQFGPFINPICRVNYIMSAVDFQPVPTRDMHENFLRAVVEILFENVVFASNQTKVVLWQPPQKLQQCFDFSLGQNGVTQEKLLLFLKNTIKFSVKTGHRYFINQLFSGQVFSFLSLLTY